MRVIDKLIINNKPPEYKTVVWIDTSDNYISKIWDSGEWKSISGIINPDGSSVIPYDDIPNQDSTTGSAGNSFKYSRGDHSHPSDTSKVDKVNGKGLSTYDYDKTAKDKVDAIPEDPKYTDTQYDDTALLNRVSAIEGKESGWDAKQDALVSGTNIKTINNESILGQGNITIGGGGGSTDVVLYTEQTLTSEQKAQARTNIGAGTSSFSGSYNDLENRPSIPDEQIQSDWDQSDTTKKDFINNKPDIPTVPTNVSAFTNDAGYLNCPIIEDTRSSAVAAITGVASFESLTNGQRIVLHFKYRNEASPTLQLTLSGGTTTSAIPLYQNYNSGVGTLTVQAMPAGSYGEFVYDATNNRWVLLGKDVNTTYSNTSQADINNSAQGSRLIEPKLLRDNFYTKTEINSTIGELADKVIVIDASTTLPSTLDPNKVYQMGTLTGVVTIPEFTSIASGDTEAKIWCFTFNTSTTAPNINWPTGISKWAGGSLPTINASKYYEVTAMDDIGVIIESSVVSS